MIDPHSLEALSASMQNVPIEGDRLKGWMWSKRGSPCDLIGAEQAIVIHTDATYSNSRIVVYLEDSQRLLFIGGNFSVGDAAKVVAAWDKILTAWITARSRELIGSPK